MQSNVANFITNFTISISLFVIVGLTVLNGKNTVGTITVALMYSQQFRGLISSFADTYKQIITSFVSIDRVKTIFDERKKIKSIIEYKNDNSETKQIEINDLNFSYSTNNYVIQNFNAEFTFPALYLIKGANGSGKTTLLNLISGNITPTDESMVHGKIIFQNLKKDFSYIKQTSFIFSGTIQENLFLRKKHNETTINDILEKTKLNKVIKELPNGIYTEVGKIKHALSQGQSQRLALARCLLQNSDLLLFDEVENAIDKETSDALIELLSQLKQQKLIVMITHRDIYDYIADKIITLP